MYKLLFIPAVNKKKKKFCCFPLGKYYNMSLVQLCKQNKIVLLLPIRRVRLMILTLTYDNINLMFCAVMRYCKCTKG